MLFQKIKRVVNRTTLKTMLSDPKQMLYSLKHQMSNGRVFKTESLSRKRNIHVANITAGNAGDTLLTVVLRDLFDMTTGCACWETFHVHDNLTDKKLNKIGSANMTVLGGGGLFLQDTNPNSISGWQWPISNDEIAKVNNLVVFSIGYNRFRGQFEFNDRFRKSVEEIVKKSTFFGLRNHGSIESLKKYLPVSLHEKISYQPCMTTVLSEIYGFSRLQNSKSIIGLNCAYDREKLRFGDKLDSLMNGLANVFKDLSETNSISYLAHSPSDEKMCKYLDANNVSYKLVKLYNRPPEMVLSEYRKLSLMVGMRGHAQMIPFGCGIPIVSIISHEKLRWFLQDINAEEWGVDVLDDSFLEKIRSVIDTVLDNETSVQNKIDYERQKLWKVTQDNMKKMKDSLGG